MILHREIVNRPKTLEKDLRLSVGLRHVLACDLDESVCQTCQKIKSRNIFKNFVMKERPEFGNKLGLRFGENFHVKRVRWEDRQAQNDSIARAKRARSKGNR